MRYKKDPKRNVQRQTEQEKKLHSQTQQQNKEDRRLRNM